MVLGDVDYSVSIDCRLNIESNVRYRLIFQISKFQTHTMLAAYKCFASGVSLLVYAVATFALSKPSDLSPITMRGIPPPPGFNVLVSFTYWLVYQLILR